MKTKFIALAFSVLFAMPCVLHAEEIEIQLFEVVGMSPIPGDDPLDDPDQNPDTPTRPRDFRATINGNVLTVTILEPSIPNAQVYVWGQSNSPVVNTTVYSTSTEWISNSGSYSLEIQTTGGTLVGNFNVQ